MGENLKVYLGDKLNLGVKKSDDFKWTNPLNVKKCNKILSICQENVYLSC